MMWLACVGFVEYFHRVLSAKFDACPCRPMQKGWTGLCHRITGHFRQLSLCRALRHSHSESSWTLKNCFSVNYSLWVSWTQACLFSKLNAWGEGGLWLRCCDNGCASCGVQALQREAKSCGFPRITGCHASSGFMVRLCLILFSIWCGFFLIYPTCRSYSSSFLVSSRENYSICSCRFGVSMRRGEFRMLLSCHFEPAQQLQFNDYTY